MNDYLKSYHLQIKTQSPIFIGDGSVLGNKEYIYISKQHRVIVPGLTALFYACAQRKIHRDFEEFMVGAKRPLGQWLEEHGFKENDFLKMEKYELDAGDYFMPSRRDPSRSAPPKDIQQFIKDPYGKPYIPGSSLKGVLRTALLAHIVHRDPYAYANELRQIRDDSRKQMSRTKYLSQATAGLEQSAFHTLGRNERAKKDAVNSIMSGLIVSDSKPLATQDLTLCQKIDLTLDGHEKRMPILRESLKPGVKIDFTVTIDETVFPFSMNTLLESLDEFNEVYYECFCKQFGKGDPQPGILWIGGGTGFGTKTVLNAAFGKEALQITDRVFQNTVRKYEEHHHNNDIALGVAPHVYKCTRYDGSLYEFGKAKISECRQI